MSQTFRTLVLALLVALLLPACASSGERAPSRNPDLITAEEIQASNARNVYELVQQQRPRWLQSRGSGSMSNPGADFPVVYVGDIRYGDIEALRTFDITAVTAVRFINAANATTRFGTGHMGGVIQLTIRR
jgi:hypothetical protein